MKPTTQIIPPNFQRELERSAYKTELKVQIEKRFADRLRNAGLWKRFKIWIQIAREVRRECDKKYPPSALYSSAR